MRVVELALIHTRIPLRKLIRHALASRQTSDNLIVCATLEDGTVGFGEAVPRRYVTGETAEGAMEQLRKTDLRSQLSPADSFSQAVAMCGKLELWQPRADPRGCYGNAACCALELSLLDAYGRSFREPLGAVTRFVPEAASVRRSTELVRYSGAIAAETWRQEIWSAIKIRANGFRDCKVKVGVDGQDDRKRLRRIRRILGPRIAVRVDANEAWKPEELPQRIEELREFNVLSVEQPVPHAQLGALGQVRGRLQVPIMHDESLCSLVDAREAIAQQSCDLFNIRLSKCGGFVRSLRIVALAHDNGIGYQLGCQVGETGILSAAGRHFATTVSGIRFLEGSYDRHLVAERLTWENLTFGYGGKARALRGFGLGVRIDRAALQRVTVRKERITLA